MNKQPIELAHDRDLRLSQQPLQRANEVAKSTGTSIVVSRNSVTEHLTPQSYGRLNGK